MSADNPEPEETVVVPADRMHRLRDEKYQRQWEWDNLPHPPWTPRPAA